VLKRIRDGRFSQDMGGKRGDLKNQGNRGRGDYIKSTIEDGRDGKRKTEL